MLDKQTKKISLIFVLFGVCLVIILFCLFRSRSLSFFQLMSIVNTTIRNLLLSEEFSQEEGGQEEEQCCCNDNCPKSFVLVMN